MPPPTEPVPECLERWERAGFDYAVVEETSTRKGIGVGGLSLRAAPSGEEVLDLDYRLTAPAHGRGLATEAVRAWTAHALEWLPDLPVVASCREANARSVRTAVTAGLEVVGTVDDAPAVSRKSTGLVDRAGSPASPAPASPGPGVIARGSRREPQPAVP